MGDGEATAQRLGLKLPSPLIEIEDPVLRDRGVELLLKRDDLIHPDVPGNKWRKIKYNLLAMAQTGSSTLLTFGGAYSNHIKATAAVARKMNLRSIGVIRGEAHQQLNSVLKFAEQSGMTLDYMDRSTYRQKNSAAVQHELRRKHGDFYLLPEGGSNIHALPGCAEAVEEIAVDFDYICCPCGTGGTLAGVSSALREHQRAIGFSALKGTGFLNAEVASLQDSALGCTTRNWHIEQDFHFGGFAKRDDTLDRYIRDFEESHGISLEWVYVAKMMFGIRRLTANGHFERGARVVALITG